MVVVVTLHAVVVATAVAGTVIDAVVRVVVVGSGGSD